MTTKQKQRHTPGYWWWDERTGGIGSDAGWVAVVDEAYREQKSDVPLGNVRADARLIAAAPAMLEALEVAERILNHAWRTVDAICGANHKEPLPIESLPEDRQEMVYELVSLLADNGEQIAAALAKARAATTQ